MSLCASEPITGASLEAQSSVHVVRAFEEHVHYQHQIDMLPGATTASDVRSFFLQIADSDMDCLLLSLPEVLLREIYGWCPDAHTVTALQQACAPLHKLRRDPSASALLLLRCRCRNYTTALRSITHAGQPSCNTLHTWAVLQQLLQPLRATYTSDGPHTTPALLLKAMLKAAVAGGYADVVLNLAATRQTPGFGVDQTAALVLAAAGKHFTTVETLLQCGACVRRRLHPKYPDIAPFHKAAMNPSDLPTLRHLLHACVPGQVPTAKQAALTATLLRDNCAAAVALFPATYATELDLYLIARRATQTHKYCVLQLLLEHHTLSAVRLGDLLTLASMNGSEACVSMLLDRGAPVDSDGGMPLRIAVHCGREGVVRALMKGGATLAGRVFTEAIALEPGVGEAAPCPFSKARIHAMIYLGMNYDW